MRPNKWISDFLRYHPPALPVADDAPKNVDWQHRVNVLESKVTENEAEVEAKDKKLAEARTAAADLLRQFAPLHESECSLKSSNRSYLLINGSLAAQVAPLNEEVERLKSVVRVLKGISKRKRGEIFEFRKQVDNLNNENDRLKETLKSIVDLALNDVTTGKAPEPDLSSEVIEKVSQWDFIESPNSTE